jgi:hypothetical protein
MHEFGDLEAVVRFMSSNARQQPSLHSLNSSIRS